MAVAAEFSGRPVGELWRMMHAGVLPWRRSRRWRLVPRRAPEVFTQEGQGPRA